MSILDCAGVLAPTQLDPYDNRAALFVLAAHKLRFPTCPECAFCRVIYREASLLKKGNYRRPNAPFVFQTFGVSKCSWHDYAAGIYGIDCQAGSTRSISQQTRSARPLLN